MSDDVEALSAEEVKRELVRALLLTEKAVEADIGSKYDTCVTYYDEASALLNRLLQSGSLVYHLSDNERDLLAEKVWIFRLKKTNLLPLHTFTFTNKRIFIFLLPTPSILNPSFEMKMRDERRDREDA